ncbi:hypothetical protein CONPUDRAFT_169361 [Coniophora puteana RWD-64-598 SS2]|uniref:3'-5' exonuclease domain-containing protein n=1 Tax=Coniophora puteana (strain RWD-64-598) TaxID=741705 RepID=A0A5M3M9D2_CONPW|nr:uncharacterized protein CONPUDRAFT_169361 [Coniophora puteana RWD-64-598 SS2]EIW75546.1 hypothetical protein CONPUDRAFT_169361 [Coniophora puteana RWD-64-598 SS2]
MDVTPPAFIYCADPGTANWALPYLEASPYIILDCEGMNIGQAGGVLSLVCVGSAHARDVFVFDVLALRASESSGGSADPSSRTDQSSALARLARVLADPGVRKVMWDCRNDYLEIKEVLGAAMRGVLDLQLAEIGARGEDGWEGAGRREGRIAAGGRRVSWRFLRDNRGLFKGVHALKGMEQALRESKIPMQGKDADVVAMHKADGSAMWLQRPLHPKLLAYAAHDIYMLDALYAKFLHDRWITPHTEPALLEQSARYALALSYQGRVAPEDVFGSCGLLPLDVLREPRGLTVPCAGCRRIQGLDCFMLQQMRGQRVRHRSNLCRVCQIKAIIKKVDFTPMLTYVVVNERH